MLSGNPGCYNQDKGITVRIDGSWIASLQRYLLQMCDDVELGLCFKGGVGIRKEVLNRTTYYPMQKHSFWGKFNLRKKDEHYLNCIRWAVEDFKPDIIEVFGSEEMLGQVYKITNIPVVLHIQGILTAIREALFPPEYNYHTDMLSHPLFFLKQWGKVFFLKYFIRREQKILLNIKYYMGRTEWDKNVINLLSPKCKYYYCSEILRPTFSQSKDIWHFHNREVIKICTIISNTTYKGSDIILRTAQLLKNAGIRIEWKVCGMDDMKFAERLTHIKAKEENVYPIGKIEGNVLKSILLDSDCYVHPSYIENSSNSICEAQILGVPVIATNVGGTSSLIKDKENGILVPSNDVYMTCTNVIRIANNKVLAEKISRNGFETAQRRHDPQVVVTDLINIYSDILSKQDKD